MSKIEYDIEQLAQWLEMSDDDYLNNTLAFKRKLRRVLQSIRTSR